MKMTFSTLLTALLLMSQGTFAHQYECTQSNMTRTISVVHEPGRELPCEVQYDKRDEGSVTTPWRASNTPGYCKQKADYLAGRLESFGWQCRLLEEQE